MFEALRRMILPIIVIVLLFFVGMIVLQWGLDIGGRGQYSGANALYAGVINGEEISWAAYQRMYNNLYQAELQDQDYDMPDEKIEELERIAWQQLLQDRLLMQEVSKRNIVVADEEVYGYLRISPPPYLQQVPSFQTDGKFDYQKYVGAMVDPSAAPFWAQIEPNIRQDLMKIKVQELVLSAATVTESEIREQFLNSTEEVKVAIANVSFRRYNAIAFDPPEEDVRAFYEANLDRYQVDERAVLDIAILEKAANEFDWERTQNRAAEIYDSAVAGSDFAELAQIYSEGPSAPKGGDLGWFKRGAMVPEFDSAIFAMKEGDISPPVRTQFGWHVIKHQGLRQQDGEDEVLASHILLKTVLSQETKDNLYNQLVRFRQKTDELGFDKATEEMEIKISTTSPFARGTATQFIGRDPFVDTFAFEQEVGAVSDIIENNSSVFVVRIAERIPPGAQPFDEIERSVTREKINDSMATLCRDVAITMHQEIENGTDLKTAAKKHDAEYVETGFFTRYGQIQGIGSDPKAIGAIFALNDIGDHTKPVDWARGTAVFRLVDRNLPDLTEFNEKRDSVYTALLNSKQQDLYGRWFDNLIQKSEIVNNTGRARSQVY